MDETLYNTTDLYMTAVLISGRYHIKEVTLEGNTRRFHFTDSPELRDRIMKYRNKDLPGDLREFVNSIETVKEILHSE